jgi:hypothetical protein
MLDRPQARTEGIIDERVDDDLVLYDRDSQTAHSLSAGAARVWEFCDGDRSMTEIAQQLQLEPALVDQALAELSERGLLVELPESLISRRQAAKRLAKVGGAAFVAPLIYSVAIGPAMAAASPVACGNLACGGSGTNNNDAKTQADAVCNASSACQVTSKCHGTFGTSGALTTYSGKCQYN